MEHGALVAAKQGLVERYGGWTAHNIRLRDDLYTRGPGVFGDEWRVARVVQLAEDVLGPCDGLRVLDLACLEGLYSVEFALRGAQVVGIEGREANLAKARFAQEALALDRLELVLDDVRNLRRERYGSFDLVLCIGILYHLDAADVVALLEQIGAVCTRMALVDTHVALAPRSTRSRGGLDLSGVAVLEHAPEMSREEREGRVWASLDNTLSFWPTEPSLLRLLGVSGFTSVAEAKVPAVAGVPPDRRTYVALKGESVRLRATDAELPPAVPTEQRRLRGTGVHAPWSPLLLRAQLAAGGLRRRLRRQRS